MYCGDRFDNGCNGFGCFSELGGSFALRQMSEFKIGDRVSNSFLGGGTVADETEVDFLVIVRFDKTPPVEYNMGENPTAQLVSQLERIK